MDYRLYRLVNGLTGNAVADHLSKVLATGLPAVLIAIVAATFFIPWRTRRNERRGGAVLGTAAAGLALLAAQPIAHAVSRIRPYAAHPHHAHLLIARSHDPSFPSDHATGAMALAIGVWLYDRTIGTVLLVLAAILCVARVYVGTHYPGDVAAGALLAAAAVALLRLPPLRRANEGAATRAGAIWDRLVVRCPGTRWRSRERGRGPSTTREAVQLVDNRVLTADRRESPLPVRCTCAPAAASVTRSPGRASSSPLGWSTTTVQERLGASATRGSRMRPESRMT